MKRLRFHNLKIRNKLLLVYFFCVLIPIILTDAIIVYTVNLSAKKEKQKEIQFLMERMEYNLKTTVTDCIQFTSNLYTDWLLNDVLNRRYLNYMDYYEQYFMLLKYNNLGYNYNNGILTKIQIYTDNDTILQGGKIAKIESVMQSEWYLDYKDSGQDITLCIYFDDTNKNIAGTGTSRTISIIRALDYYGKKGIENLLKIDINYDIMWRDVLNEKIDAEIYVRNEDYILFSNQSNEGSMKAFSPAASVKTGSNVMSRKFIVSRQEWEIIVKPTDTESWIDIMGNKSLLTLVLMNILLPSIMIFIVGKSITRRLSLVVVHMDGVKKEKFEEIQEIPGEDEIGVLIRSYNIMICKIRNLIQVVFKEQVEKQALDISKKQAELKAVQSQVNPHFLFNTLESVRMRSLIKGEEETADIIGEMAALFRRSMTWKSDFVTIEEELGFVEKYIKIQRYRFGDKITYNHYIMEGCKQYLVPKLSIGTFVENACVHGLEASADDGVISLNITKNTEYLFIEISDNGRGVEEQRLKELREMFKNADCNMLNEAKSTGMLNAFLRFKMCCEGKTAFNIVSSPENGTDITIDLPLSGLINLGRKIENDQGNDCR